MVAAVAETGLIAQPQGSNGSGGMSIYDRIEPMKFIEEMGSIFAQTGAGGADTLAKGKLLALACLCRRKDIFEISDTYHLIKGRLSMKAEVLLARFRQKGGKHKWIKDGSDKIEAIGEFTFEGQICQVGFSMADAATAQLLTNDPKKAGNWEKYPAPMMRARVISMAITMIAPEVKEGVSCQEDLEGEQEAVAVTVVSSAPSAASVVGVDQGATGATGEKPVRKRRAAAEMVVDAAKATSQPQGDPSAASQAAGQAVSDDGVIEASYTATETNQDGSVTTTNVETTETTVVTQPAATTAAAAVEQQQSATTASTSAPQLKEAVFNPDLPGTSTTPTLHKISGLIIQLGHTQKSLEDMLRQKDPAFKDIPSLSETKALGLAAQLEQHVAAYKAQQLAATGK